MMNLVSRSFLASLAMTLFVSGVGTVQSQEGELLRVARDSAIIAGGGRYCKFDPDEIESFTARAEARLSVLARDDYEKVLARLEFKNNLDAFSARAPEGGCQAFKAIFDQALRSIR